MPILWFPYFTQKINNWLGLFGFTPRLTHRNQKHVHPYRSLQQIWVAFGFEWKSKFYTSSSCSRWPLLSSDLRMFKLPISVGSSNKRTLLINNKSAMRNRRYGPTRNCPQSSCYFNDSRFLKIILLGINPEAILSEELRQGCFWRWL